MEKKNFFTYPLVITLCALLCCALWGSATPFIKLGYELIMPHGGVPSTLVFAGVRFFFAGVLTVIIFSIARKKFLYPKKENLGRVGIVAVTGDEDVGELPAELPQSSWQIALLIAFGEAHPQIAHQTCRCLTGAPHRDVHMLEDRTSLRQKDLPCRCQ